MQPTTSIPTVAHHTFDSGTECTVNLIALNPRTIRAQFAQLISLGPDSRDPEEWILCCALMELLLQSEQSSGLPLVQSTQDLRC